jgi:hypothetical protein
MEAATVTVFPVNKHPNYPKELLAETKVKYTIPYSGESRQVLRPLTEEQEKELFPAILHINSEDLSFREQVSEYYKSLSLPIPYDGLVFELTPDEISGAKKPSNVTHYILYNAMLKDLNVATKDEDVKNNFFFTYYIVDGLKEKQEKEKTFEIQKKVDKTYMNLLNREGNKGILKSIVILFRTQIVKTVMEISSMSTIELEMELKGICNKYPEEFSALVPNEEAIKKLQVKADAESYSDSGLITLVGDQIDYEGTIVARSMAEFKKLLSSGEGSKMYAELQTKFKELVK